jgi:hypothetical protein
MLRINHILLLLILLASHMDSQHIALWLCSFYLHLRRIMNPPFHPSISLPICEPIFISPTSYRNSPMGPPPFISFPEISALPGALISHWGTHFCILYIFPHIYSLFLVQTPLFSGYLLLSSPLATYFPFGHTQPMSPLVGALLLIYPRRHRLYLQSTTQTTYLYPLNLFTLSRLWHNLYSVLASP